MQLKPLAANRKKPTLNVLEILEIMSVLGRNNSTTARHIWKGSQKTQLNYGHHIQSKLLVSLQTGSSVRPIKLMSVSLLPV